MDFLEADPPPSSSGPSPVELDAACCVPERRWACRVEDRGRGRHRVHLSGSLHAGWAGRLAAGLAGRKISIQRVVGRRGKDMTWDAELDVELPERGATLDGFDFLATTLDHEDPQRPVRRVGIRSYAIRRTHEDVAVEVRGPDVVGFLDGVLRVFAFYGLFPHALRIETRGREAVDLFRLQSLGGRVPSMGVVAALEQRLDELVVGREARGG